MTIETNLATSKHPELHAAAEKLLAAAMEYWKASQEYAGGGAVVWLTDSDGRMVILTRGEYRDTLMRNIHRLEVEADPVKPFDPR